MTHPPKKTTLIDEALFTFLLGAGLLVGTFYSSVFLQKPQIAWTILLIPVITGLMKGSVPEKILKNIRAVIYGLFVAIIFVIFLLSTGGKTGILGTIPESGFADITTRFGWFALTYFWLSALILLILGFMGKKGKISYAKTTPVFIGITIAAFAVLFININGFLPWLKPYDIVLFMSALICFRITFSLHYAK